MQNGHQQSDRQSGHLSPPEAPSEPIRLVGPVFKLILEQGSSIQDDRLLDIVKVWNLLLQVAIPSFAE